MSSFTVSFLFSIFNLVEFVELLVVETDLQGFLQGYFFIANVFCSQPSLRITHFVYVSKQVSPPCRGISIFHLSSLGHTVPPLFIQLPLLKQFPLGC